MYSPNYAWTQNAFKWWDYKGAHNQLPVVYIMRGGHSVNYIFMTCLHS